MNNRVVLNFLAEICILSLVGYFINVKTALFILIIYCTAIATLFIFSPNFYSSYYKLMNIRKDLDSSKERITQAFTLYIISILLYFQIRNITNITSILSANTIILIIIVSITFVLLSVYVGLKTSNKLSRISLYIIIIFILISIIIKL